MRPIHEIAKDIVADWNRPYFGAVPYLRAMSQLADKTSYYGVDRADNIVAYFLSNAATYKGEKARTYKKELKEHLK